MSTIIGERIAPFSLYDTSRIYPANPIAPPWPNTQVQALSKLPLAKLTFSDTNFIASLQMGSLLSYSSGGWYRQGIWELFWPFPYVVIITIKDWQLFSGTLGSQYDTPIWSTYPGRQISFTFRERGGGIWTGLPSDPGLMMEGKLMAGLSSYMSSDIGGAAPGTAGDRIGSVYYNLLSHVYAGLGLARVGNYEDWITMEGASGADVQGGVSITGSNATFTFIKAIVDWRNSTSPATVIVPVGNPGYFAYSSRHSPALSGVELQLSGTELGLPYYGPFPADQAAYETAIQTWGAGGSCISWTFDVQLSRLLMVDNWALQPTQNQYTI